MEHLAVTQEFANVSNEFQVFLKGTGKNMTPRTYLEVLSSIQQISEARIPGYWNDKQQENLDVLLELNDAFRLSQPAIGLGRVLDRALSAPRKERDTIKFITQYQRGERRELSVHNERKPKTAEWAPIKAAVKGFAKSGDQAGIQRYIPAGVWSKFQRFGAFDPTVGDLDKEMGPVFEVLLDARRERLDNVSYVTVTATDLPNGDVEVTWAIGHVEWGDSTKNHIYHHASGVWEIHLKQSRMGADERLGSFCQELRILQHARRDMELTGTSLCWKSRQA